MIDSFGYTVKSLREVIADLSQIGESFPAMLDQPIWVDNCPPLKWPVLYVGVDPGPRGWECSPGARSSKWKEEGTDA